MKWKQIFFTVAISAVTTLGVIWGYGTFFAKNTTYAGQQDGVVPANYKYAGLLDGNTPPGNTVDFTAPAEAATPAVVHIKTKTNAKQVNNSLPKRQPNNPFSDFIVLRYNIPGDQRISTAFYNASGALLIRQDYHATAGSGTYTLYGFENFPAGAYFLKTECGDFLQTFKLIRNKK